MISRKQFIESHGATCRNWRWSWSFVNNDQHLVIFGAWNRTESLGGEVILADGWQYLNGRRQPGYSQSLEHIDLVKDGYALFTFPMMWESTETGAANIRTFIPSISRKSLRRRGGDWLAIEDA